MNAEPQAQESPGADKQKAAAKSAAGGKKETGDKRYEITVHKKNPHDPNFVDVQHNGGGCTRIRVGQKVQVRPEVLQILMDAQETVYTFFEAAPEGNEAYEEDTSPLYPVTVHREIEA